MASTFRGRKTLVCFYCNKKSGLKYDGFTTKWDCAKCDATNFLDEKGEITDPPVDGLSTSGNRDYAVPRPESPPFFQSSETDLFCSTCLKNQHLLTSSIAQYDVDMDPMNPGPNYRAQEREFFKYKRGLEERYPQVCEDCKPKVQARMNLASKTAKSDYLGRLLDKSRTNRLQKPKPISPTGYLLFAGKTLWYAGLVGQCVWSSMTLAAYILHKWPIVFSKLPRPVLELFEAVVSTTTSSDWARFSLYASVLSSWWNPMLGETGRGFGRHVSGQDDWYKFQALMIVSRSIFFYTTGTGVLVDPFSEETVGGHTFMFAFITLLAYKTRRALKIEIARLWDDSPSDFRYVGPGGSSPPVAESMTDILNSIANTPTDGISSQPFSHSSPHSSIQKNNFSPSPLGQSSGYTQRAQPLGNSFPKVRHNASIKLPQRTTPSLSDMTEKELSRYMKTGEVPAHLPQTYDNDPMEMDWDPAPPSSEHRAFQMTRTIERNTQLFSQAPVSDQQPAFWYKVPPAPTTPAQRLRNPPNQPRLRVASQELKANFFNNVTRRGSNSNEFGTPRNEEKSRTQHEIVFAQQKFFPPSPPSEADNNLSDLFTSFSLGSDNVGPANERKPRIRHVCQASVLSLGLFFWNQSYSNPGDHSTNVLLVVMVSCLLIGARTVIDSTLSAKLDKSDGFSNGMKAMLGVFESGVAVYRMVEIAAGRGDCTNCASIGTLLLGTMLVQELFYVSYGH